MAYRLFTTSQRAWGAMLEAISVAEKSIYLEMYIFDDHIDGFNFLEELIEVARRGVRVYIILDVIGSLSLGKEPVERLRQAGVEVLYYSFWFRRTHRKILVIDERIAFVGGVNVGRQFRFWKDLQVCVKGRGVVAAIASSFVRVYQECGGRDPALAMGKKRSSIFHRAKTWFIEHRVGQKNRLRAHYQDRVSHAQRSIILVTPYLVPPRWLLAILHQALLRGVCVEVLVPRKTDYWFIDKVNQYYISILSRVGAACYIQPDMNHAKAMLVDGKEGIIGSHNLDTLSFHWNTEAGIFFSHEKLVAELAAVIEGWKKDAVLFDARTQSFFGVQFFATVLRWLRIMPL